MKYIEKIIFFLLISYLQTKKTISILPEKLLIAY